MIKKLCVFRLKAWEYSQTELDEILSEYQFQPPATTEFDSDGFVSPDGSGNMTYGVNGAILVNLKHEQKVLPSSTVREATAKAVASREEREGRKLKRKEVITIRDEVIYDLIQKALTKSAVTNVIIDTTAMLLYVEAASYNAAEKVVSLLREAIGSLPCKPLRTATNPAAVMTQWVAEACEPATVVLGDSCTLADDDGKVTAKSVDLFSDEIQAHITAGKQITSCEITYDERVQCTLSDDLSIKRIKYTDLVEGERAQEEIETLQQRFDTDLYLFVQEMRALVKAMATWFGGIAE